MTLPPERLGDKGQRYTIVYVEHGGDRFKDYAYTDSFETAQKLHKSWLLHPEVFDAKIIDRGCDEKN